MKRKPSTSPPPLGPDAQRRIKAARAGARQELVDSLVKHFETTDQDELAKADYRALAPYFNTYSETVFNAYAQEYLRLIGDPTEYVKALRSEVIGIVLREIRPDRFCTNIEASSDDAPRPDELPFTFNEGHIAATVPKFVEEKVWNQDTQEFELTGEVEETYEDPWKGIDYEGVWEQTLDLVSRQGTVSTPNAFDWNYLRVLRDLSHWNGFKWGLLAHLESRLPGWEQKALSAPSQADQGMTKAPTRRRGPKPSRDHSKVAATVEKYGDKWRESPNLGKLCKDLDNAKIPVAQKRTDSEYRPLQPLASSWLKALRSDREAVVKAIEHSLNAAKSAAGPTKE